MRPLDRAARAPFNVADHADALLAHGTQIQMVPKEPTQQLTTSILQLIFELTMSQSPGRLVLQERDQTQKLGLRPLKRVRRRPQRPGRAHRSDPLPA